MHRVHQHPYQPLEPAVAFSSSPNEPDLFDFDLGDAPAKQSQFALWDTNALYPPPSPAVSASPASSCSQLDFSSPPTSFEAHAFPHAENVDYSSWIVDDYAAPSSATSAPMTIPSTADNSLGSFSSKLGAYSPSFDTFSLPPQMYEPSYEYFGSSQASPPSFTSLWQPAPEQPQPSLLFPPPAPVAFDNQQTVRATRSRRAAAQNIGTIFASTSAPSDFAPVAMAAPAGSRNGTIRAYSSARAKRESASDDYGTARRKRKGSDASDASVPASSSPPVGSASQALSTSPARSHLRPPKLAPSTWQLWFADWIQRQQATSDRKLNVAQAAKEAGAEYAQLSAEEKEPYVRRSLQLKAVREQEHATWLASLSPDDIRRENVFRASQRRAGKSRRSNIKDPNAPRKPLSAYFTFIAWIRADPARVIDVFGNEQETTRQSVLAAARWREMSDDEKRPFLAQAEHDRLDYEAAKKVYDEQTTGNSSGVSFSVHQGGGFIHSMLLPIAKDASDSD